MWGNFIISVHMTSGIVKLTSVQSSLRSNWPKWNFRPQRVFHVNSKIMLTWEEKWTQTGMRFHFGWKSHFGVQSTVYLCSHEMRQNETQNSMDFTSVNLTEMKFQTGMRFSTEHTLPETKWISADSLDVAINAHVRLKLNGEMDFISVTWTEMKFHFKWQNIM